MPYAINHSHVFYSINDYASPIVGRTVWFDGSAAAVPAELIAESLFSTLSVCSDDMRAHKPLVPVIDQRDLTHVKNRLPDNLVGVHFLHSVLGDSVDSASKF